MDSAKGPTEWGEGRHGVGPWQGPWPEDPRYDPEFLEHGDRRNVVDAYRYLSLEAIRAEHEIPAEFPPEVLAEAAEVAGTDVVAGMNKESPNAKQVKLSTNWSVIMKDPKALDLRITLNK